ncbi:MAG: serine/threonine protein kinase [Myxococcales bacterium]|jgi:serine/threonine-protein kinase|nr:serine/threonine protein kinase [Myxococcales bacterium]MBP6845838.1 serine/threonine protein kinase [Kofleriaceae bacterium]
MSTPGRIRVAPWSPASTREEARAYVESRLALFATLMFWIFWILVAFLYGMYTIWPYVRPSNVGFVFQTALVGQMTFAAIWYFALRRRQLSLEWLYRIDAFCVIVIGLEMGVSAYAQAELHAAIYSAFIWHSFTIMGRTLIVPSSGKRTAVVTAISFVPLEVAAIALGVWHPSKLDVPGGALVIGTAVYSGVAVWLATTGSRLIYGLRRQVSEAMQLGQYTLEVKIGEGGMGTVYRARHAMLRRPTAIKLLPPERHEASSFKRFEREVQHMSQLSHPNTVAIFDYGRSVDGVFYYAMEYLDGIDLERLVRTHGAQPPARVAHILAQVCGSLAEAHGLGLTHRDVKPANVILCQRGGHADIAMVVDFGLVKEVARLDDDTRTAAIAGTPAYMSPEAITDPTQVGPASDLYSLGALGYFLLTATRVFEGKTAMHVCAQHVTDPPVPPSQRVATPISADLEALILRCLAKEPAARPASARALRAALKALPLYADWDELQAQAWWDVFATARAAATAGPSAPPLTITREFASLTDRELTPRDDEPAAGQATETGQLR